MSCFGGNRKKKQTEKMAKSEFVQPQPNVSGIPVEQENRDPNRKGTNVSMNLEGEHQRDGQKKPTLTNMNKSEMKSLNKVDIEYKTSTNRQIEDLVFAGKKVVKMDLAVHRHQPENLVRGLDYLDETKEDPKVAALDRAAIATYKTSDSMEGNSIVVKRFVYDHEAKSIV